MTKWGFIVVIVMVISAVAAIALLLAQPEQSSQSTADEVAQAPPAPQTQPPPPARRTACQHRVGEETGLALNLRTTMNISPSALGGGNMPEQQVVSTTVATVTIRAIKQLPGDELVVALRLTSVRSAVNGKPAVDPAISEALSQAFLLHVTRRCKVRRFGRHRSIKPRSASLFQSVADILDIELPRPGVDTYRAHHDDQYGNYLGTYKRSKDLASAGLWTRTRSGYRATNDATAGSAMSFRSAAARTTFTPANGLGLAAAHVTGAVVVMQNGRRLLTDTSKHAIAATAPVADAFKGTDLELANYVWGRLDPNQMASLAGKSDVAKLVGVPLDKAWQQFSALRKGPNGHMAAVKFLTSWLKANPGGAGELVQRIRGGDFDESERAMIVHAMSKAGTPQGRAALLEMAESGDMDYKVRTQAVSALGDLVNPNEDTIRRLAALGRGEGTPSKLGFVQGAATLAIGTLLGESRHADSAVTQSGREELNGLLASDDPQKVKQALGAIGNSGDVEFLGAAQAKLNDAEPRTRAAAVRALRLMDAEKVQPVFTKVLQSESDPNVIAELAWAHAIQVGEKKVTVTPEQMTSYSRRLRGSPSESARRAIIEVLGKMSGKDSQAMRLLAKWFWKEPSNSLKGVIGQFVPASLLAQSKP